MKKYHYVYITTNLINGRQYVGDRSCDCLPEEDINYLGSGRPLFKNTLKKYGKKNFKKEILEIFESRKESHANEKKYIRLYETHVSQGGYNISWKGGYGSINDTLSEETKQKIREAHIGKKFSESHIRNLSESHKGITYENRILNFGGELNPFYGKKHSKESKEIMKQKKLGKKQSEEHKQNRSISMMGKNKYKRTEEHKQKISNSVKGKKTRK